MQTPAEILGQAPALTGAAGAATGQSITVAAGNNATLLSQEDLSKIQDDFVRGLDELEKLAGIDIDPHRELLEQLPRYMEQLRKAAGIEVSQEIADRAQSTTEALMMGASDMVSRLMAERAEYERDPNKALLELMAPVAVLAATGGITPEDLQMIMGILAVSRDKIQKAKLAEYDDRIRTIQSGVLQWYRQYNLAKAQQNAPFLQMALESGRLAGRMTKLALDKASRVFNNHLNLNRLRLSALKAGADYHLRVGQEARKTFTEWWQVMIRLTRTITTLGMDNQSMQLRQALAIKFAEYTDSLVRQFEEQGIKSPIPRLEPQDVAALVQTLNPETALTMSLTRRADADTRRLIAQANNLDIQTQDVATRLVYRGLDKYDEELIKSLKELGAASTSVESDNAANMIVLYADMLTANSKAAAEAARQSGARVRGGAASAAAEALTSAASLFLKAVLNQVEITGDQRLIDFMRDIKNRLANIDQNDYNRAIEQYNAVIAELRRYQSQLRNQNQTMSNHIGNLVRVLETSRQSVAEIARAYAPQGNEEAEVRATQHNFLRILAGAVR